MSINWDREEIESILLQLNRMSKPFKKFRFTVTDNHLNCLGTGGEALVFEAAKVRRAGKCYAIKVVGFHSNFKYTNRLASNSLRQQKTASFNENILTVLDFKEYCLTIENNSEVSFVEEIGGADSISESPNKLILQFVLLEKAVPIISGYGAKRNIDYRCPKELQEGYEEEIVRLALEIANGIKAIHRKGIIHRDVKLENIFFSPYDKKYKLGDFGIVEKIEDGYAVSCALTPGYGAPEVFESLNRKYDFTADIFSFGMVLYLLLNELKFPNSKNYHPDFNQYKENFEMPKPEYGSSRIVAIVLKMLAFNPEERYQSIDEVIEELSNLKYSEEALEDKWGLERHKMAPFVLGTFLALMASAIGGLFFNWDKDTGLSYLETLIYIAFVLKGLISFNKNKLPMFILGIVSFGLIVASMISGGFSWWKVLLLILAFGGERLGGIIGGCILISQIVHWLTEYMNPVMIGKDVLCCLTYSMYFLSIILLTRFMVIDSQKESYKFNKLFRKIYWIGEMIISLLLIVLPNSVYSVDAPLGFWQPLIGQEKLDIFVSGHPPIIGLVGLGFMIFWLIRDYRIK